MTIKDAAERTGLSQKSIRYYESKGLLRVERGPENAYRQYTDEDIERLKLIKLLRWLGLSVEEIAAEAEKNWGELPETLNGLSRRLEEESQHALGRQRLCEKLAEDWKSEGRSAVIAEYVETVSFIESDEGRGMLGVLEQTMCVSLPTMILSSFVWLGPIGWLFFRVFTRRWESLPVTAAAALFSAAALTLQWERYFRVNRRRQNLSREANRRNRALLPLVLLTVVGSIGLAVGLFLARERLFAPVGWLFYEAPWWADLGLILLSILLVLSAVGVLVSRRQLAAEDIKDTASFLRFVRRTWRISIPVLLLLVYCCFTSGTYVTETTILRHTPLRPAGVEYAYTDVARVETDFGSAWFSPAEYRRRGQFSYRFILNDGAEAVFHAPQPNNDVVRFGEADATYLELEEFDAALMELGIPKTASDTNWEYCELDQQYVDRFLRIIRNKPAPF